MMQIRRQFLLVSFQWGDEYPQHICLFRRKGFSDFYPNKLLPNCFLTHTSTDTHTYTNTQMVKFHSESSERMINLIWVIKIVMGSSGPAKCRWIALWLCLHFSGEQRALRANHCRRAPSHITLLLSANESHSEISEMKHICLNEYFHYS